MGEETQVQEQSNPFDVEAYRNSDLPDQPLLTSDNMIQAMLNNDEVPKEIRDKAWWIFNKDNVLGFLDAERKASKLLNFDIIKHDMMTTMRRKAYTFSTEVDYDILRNVFETKLDRAVGSEGGENRTNERKALISQIQENRVVNDGNQGLIKEGFIKKLMGKR